MVTNANPYKVEPGNDLSQGLTGLTETVGQVVQQKRKEGAIEAEKTRIEGIKTGAVETFKTGDPDKIAEYSLKNPEISELLIKLSGHKNEQTEENYRDALLDFHANPTEQNAMDIIQTRQSLLKSQGVGPESSQETNSFLQRFQENPDLVKNNIAMEIAGKYPKRWKSLQGKEEKSTTDIKEYEFAQKQGYKGDFVEYKNKFGSSVGAKTYSPSPLKKLMNERQDLIDAGVPLDDPKVKAYDSKITGVDIDIENLTQPEIDTFGAYFNATGKMPSLGRGKQSTKIRMAIAKSAARQALGAEADGVPEGTPDQTPSDAAFDMISSQSDTKAIQGSLNFLDKQLSSMGSFVTNLNSQVEKVKELSKDLKTFDASLLNKPLRYVRGKLKGSALQAKYDMYLAEIESEIGKLATGSTGSVAELSASAQEKWAGIHDKNLSVEKMMELLEETKNAANFRLESVQGQLEKTRTRMRHRTGVQGEQPEITATNPQTGQKLILVNGKWEVQ